MAYDLLWLWESGFKYDGAVFDTMLAEYVLQRGVKEPLSLQACAERYECDTKKQDTLKEYLLDLMYTHTPLKLLVMQVSLRVDRMRRRIRLLHSTAQQDMAERKQKQHTTPNTPLSLIHISEPTRPY